MRTIRTAQLIGYISLPIWVVFYITLFGDLYLSGDPWALVLPMLSHLTPIANLIGLILGLTSLRRYGRLALPAVLLNAVPFVAALCTYVFLFATLRM